MSIPQRYSRFILEIHVVFMEISAGVSRKKVGIRISLNLSLISEGKGVILCTDMA